MGAYSHILKKSDASIYFQKWNAAFRNENTIVGEKAVLLVINDIENSYIFSLLSKKTGVRVSLFDSIIYDENILDNGISSIGTIPDWFNYQSNMFLGHYSPNPLKNDDRIIIKESLIPVIKRTYGNYEAFQNVCSQIIKNDKVHLNHILSATERDYQVDDDTIDVELILNGKQLTGAVTIGLVKMPIWINPVGEGFEAFRKELSTDKNFNEAIFILSYNNYESTFYFNKSLIKIRYC